VSGYLAGAAVQKVDLSLGAVLLRVRAPGATRWVILAAGPRGGVGVCLERPWKGVGLPGEVAAAGHKALFRKRLEGARIRALGERTAAFELDGVVQVLRAPGKEAQPVAFAGPEAEVEPRDEEVLLAEGARLAEELGEGALAARRSALGRAIARAEARIARRIAAVRGDLARIAEADGIAARASLFVVEAARAPRGATQLRATDWSSGEPREVEIALDPARSAREQVDAMFKRARRLKQGATIAAQPR
jgi:hypothetical protein